MIQKITSNYRIDTFNEEQCTRIILYNISYFKVIEKQERLAYNFSIN